jgi:hypothetical protein
MNTEEILLHWIRERLSILKRKNACLLKPWTTDKILQSYRFCNVHREDDTVTMWIDKHWRKQDGSFDNVVNMVIARTVNWPDTLEEIKPFDGDLMWFESARIIMKMRRSRGDKVWTGAYMISTNGNKMDKIDYIIDKVWIPFYRNARTPATHETLESYWKHLRQFDGLGSFMAAQVICDLKYCDPTLRQAMDWWDWAALGPGSTRGLNRFFERDKDKPLKQEQGLAELRHIRNIVQQKLQIQIHTQDIQNVMCELDKYLRVRNGEGRPRSLYNGQA